MTHILRINEMAVRNKNIVDAAIAKRNAETFAKEQSEKKIKEKALSYFVRNFKKAVKQFPIQDAIDAYDTYEYVGKQIGFNKINKGDIIFVEKKKKYNEDFDKHDIIVGVELPVKTLEENEHIYLGYDIASKEMVIWSGNCDYIKYGIRYYYGGCETWYIKDYVKSDYDAYYYDTDRNKVICGGFDGEQLYDHNGFKKGKKVVKVDSDELIKAIGIAIGDFSKSCEQFFKQTENL